MRAVWRMQRHHDDVAEHGSCYWTTRWIHAHHMVAQQLDERHQRLAHINSTLP